MQKIPMPCFLWHRPKSCKGPPHPVSFVQNPNYLPSCPGCTPRRNRCPGAQGLHAS